MRKKLRRHNINKNRKYKLRKKTSSNFITISTQSILFFFGIIFLLTTLTIYHFNTPQRRKSSNTFAAAMPLQLFEKIPTSSPKLSDKFIILKSMISSFSATAAPRKTPKFPLQIPIVNAQANQKNDFCLNVPILLYHHVQPLSLASQLGHAQLTVDSDYFENQMAYLIANKYQAISGEELGSALIERRALPSKSILITFDDGYDDNYTYAYNILKKYNIPGNFMIITGLVGTSGYMTWDHLKEMSGNPLMHIYNHTVSHLSLGAQTKEKIEYEIGVSNDELESQLNKPVKIFTYPYGSISQPAMDVLKNHGFTAAFSTIEGTLQCDSYILALRRIRIGNAPLSQYGL